jgi:alkylhydroperoxidase family enzyme
MINPPELDALTPEQKSVYETFPANITHYLVLAEASAKPYLDLGMSFRYSTLTPRDRETVILRVGGLLDNPYEALQHKEIARSSGLDDAVIERLLNRAADFDDPRIAKLVAYVDAAVGNAVGPETVDALTDNFTDRQVSEIALLTGHYVMTSIFLKSLNVPLDPEPTAWGDVPL